MHANKKTRKAIKKAMRSCLWVILFVILLLAGICIIFRLIGCLCPTIALACNDFCKLLGSDWAGNSGGFIAGIGALVSLYFLYKTFRSQRKQSRREKFENHFFQLLNTDRNIMDSTHAHNHFNSFWERIKEVEKVLTGHFSPSEASHFYLHPDKFSVFGKDLGERGLIDISFQIAFWGTDTEGWRILHQNLSRTYNAALLEKMKPLLEVAGLLGHPGFHKETAPWFRMLYQTIRYVGDQKWLDRKQKREYVKMLRAQISNIEAAVLFYDSISEPGLDWEFQLSCCGKWTRKKNGKAFVTRYDLFGNIPDGLVDYNLIHKFYPEMRFCNETSNKCSCSQQSCRQ